MSDPLVEAGLERRSGRDLAWWQWLIVVLVYLAIIQGGGRLIGADVDSDDAYATATGLLESTIAPIALSAVFAVAVAT